MYTTTPCYSYGIEISFIKQTKGLSYVANFQVHH